MNRTANETQQQTLTRLRKAMNHRHPITITYTKADDTVTVRTIEAYDIQTTKAGNTVIKAMDRESGEARTWRLDRIEAYTIHRTAYLLPASGRVSEPEIQVIVNAPTVPAFPPALAALIDDEDDAAWEIARDDRKYWTARYDVDDFDPWGDDGAIEDVA